jgi:hypothetical protein
MQFFGLVYLISSTFILIFKKENSKTHSSGKIDESAESMNNLSLLESYKTVWKIMCLKPIHKIIFILFTLRVFILNNCLTKINLKIFHIYLIII